MADNKLVKNIGNVSSIENINFYFEQKIQTERRKKDIYLFLRKLILTVIIVYILFGVISGVAIVQGESMEPTLINNSILFFYRLENSYKKDDIVILEVQSRQIVKRIVAIAGDIVDINSDTGELLINGKIQQKISVVGETHSRNQDSYPLKVPKGYVFVLGDNREKSVDSRDFGTIKTDDLLGKVMIETKWL